MDSILNKPAESLPVEYGQEVLCASWNPLVAAVGEPVEAARKRVSEPKSVDGETFLARFYRSQQG